MGWGYRKRIKILPGIHLNISKKGISTNIGIKGANVTFGSKGTYVNTGIPGTGLYRRDKVSGSIFENSTSYTEPLSVSSGVKNDLTDNSTGIKVSVLYVSKLWPLLIALFSTPLFFYLYVVYDWWMFFCCLFAYSIQFICVCIASTDIEGHKISFDVSCSEYETDLSHYIRMEKLYKVLCSVFFIIIASLDLFPFFAKNKKIVTYMWEVLKLPMERYEGGICVTLLTFFTLFLLAVWLFVVWGYNIKSDFEQKVKDQIIPQPTPASDNTDKMEQAFCSPKHNQEKTPILQKSFTLSKTEDPSIDVEGGYDEQKYVEIGDDDMDDDLLMPYDPKRDLENYRCPTLDLLNAGADDGRPYIDMEEQKDNKNRIVEVLRMFGVEISSIKATVGPTITLYEMILAPGIRISEVRSLEDDIAFNLAVLGACIIAPIPGKGTVGIGIPNTKPVIVSMGSILNTRAFQETTMDLPCAMGKTITNEVFMFDLAKAPHLLIGGATGQGKSVGLNVILTSLLYKKHPAELKFVLMDSKMVEFSIYRTIARHFLAALPEEADNPIITNTSKVVRTLNSLCVEMDARNELLMMAGERNIKDYNRKFIARKLNPKRGHRFMPYIVIVIDEYESFFSEGGQEFEAPIARLARYARAVGIHLIISTNRPSHNVITGTIKANFPTRIAFKVSQSIDSKIILDRTGAQQLMGRGDMLYLQGNDPVRVQCAFVDTPEVNQINQFIAQQQGYIECYELPEPLVGDGDGMGESHDVDMSHLDPMFSDAARLIVSTQKGSMSLIQRKFSLGYNRAGRLMDQLEKAGIVGQARGSKPREVLIQDEMSLENLLNTLN